MTTTVAEKKDAKELTKEQTALSRDPWQTVGFPSLKRMRQEFDDLWGKFFTEVPALWSAERADSRWAFDVEDTADAYVIKAEAPGFEPKDFHVDLRGNQLVMQAKRSEEKTEKGKESFTATEFYHAMTLPQHVDADKIAATYKQGVLQISLPKTEEGKGRKITVKG
ncbi:MAG: Hsp20/alpha crystallin family protein [Planctomycetaceae bacterium]|nr:Hsp20/alpha crystallin family protein [Planctomycetaceae bacterium]